MLDRVPLAALAAVVGWCLGWLSAWFSAWLVAEKEEERPALRGPLVRDPYVQAGSALAWAAAVLALGDFPRWAEAGLLAVPLIQVAVTDIRTRYVYTFVAWIGTGLGLAFGWHLHNAEWWTSLAGAAGAFAAFGILHLLGRVWGRLLYGGRVEAMASGDITIAAMVGAGAATCTPQALFLGVLIGGLLAVGFLVTGRSRHAFMPYGPGLCIGGLAVLYFC